MGGYGRTPLTTYLVVWDEESVVKVGISDIQRWRPFLIRGARVAQLYVPTDWRDACAMETELLEILKQVGEYAFNSKAEAEPFLGNGGGGYLECFRFSQGSIEDALGQCYRAMLRSNAQAFGSCIARKMPTNERTNVLTNDYLHSVFLGTSRNAPEKSGIDQLVGGEK